MPVTQVTKQRNRIWLALPVVGERPWYTSCTRRRVYPLFCFVSTTLFTAYLHWQYLSAPHWLLQLYGNLQRVLWQYFSVRFMVRTLLAPWRRDIVSYRGLSLDRMAMALAWNSISRFVGGALRLLIIALWALAEVVLLSVGAIIMVTFIVWPVVVAVGVMTGVVLLIASWQ